METFIDISLKYLWIGDVLPLAIFSLIAFQRKRLSSTFMTQTLVVVVSGTVIKYKNMVNGFVAPQNNQWIFGLWCFGFIACDLLLAWLLYRYIQHLKVKVNKAAWCLAAWSAMGFILGLIYLQWTTLFADHQALPYKFWVIIAYYFGIAFMFGLAIYIIRQLHLLTNIAHTLLAKTYILAFFVAATLHIGRFSERYFWHSDVFEGFFQLSLASINIGTTLIAVSLAIMAVSQYLMNNTPKRVLWKL